MNLNPCTPYRTVILLITDAGHNTGDQQKIPEIVVDNFKLINISLS